MSQVTVRRADKSTSSTQALMDSLDGITSSIRNRAFELSQSGSGDSTRNWIQAEKDLYRVPSSQLSENAQQYQMQVAVPGLNSSDLEVIAMTNSIVVRSTATNASSGNSSSGGSSGGGSSNRGGSNNMTADSTVFNDMDSRTTYRRFDLSSSIDTSSVSASLDNGMLNITARKAASRAAGA